MHLARSGVAVAAGFIIFSALFALIGPGLGAVLTAVAAGLMSGYLAAKIALSRELTHGGVTAGLVAASLLVQPTFAFGVRLLIAALAAAAITAGAWVRSQARMAQPDLPEERGRS